MNDPNKRIDVNLSSLLSLKAELLRKHQEVSKAKTAQHNQASIPTVSAQRRTGNSSSKPKSKSKTTTESQAPNKTNNNETPRSVHVADTYEIAEMLQKSKSVLEAKSKFYDRMARSGGSLNSDENCLVLFNQKKQTDGPRNGQYSISSSSSSSSDADTDDDEAAEDGDWVEYTDCLGRTRKCLKEDLESAKQKDLELAASVGTTTGAPKTASDHGFVEPAAPPTANRWFVDTKGAAASVPSVADDSSSDDEDAEDTQSMISKSSKIEEMHNNWDRQEMENASKESIHYQDVLFDEARSHGVGYYAFSTDGAERDKQQKELETMRQKTLTAQQQRDAQRKAREKIIADRVRAAQNRQRARAGLPPLEEVPAAPEPATVALSATAAKAAKREAKRAKKAAAEADRRAAERQLHIRPWDHGKDGVRKTGDEQNAKKQAGGSSDSDGEDNGQKTAAEWSYKPEREPMSQEQWNELQRAERRDEFAPIVDLPLIDESHLPVYGFQARSSTKRSYAQSTLASQSQPPPPTAPEQRFNNPFVRRPVERPSTGNVDADDDGDDDVDYNIAPPPMTAAAATEAHSSISRNPEFAPPPTFEYYGPAASSSKSSRPPKAVRPDQLENSIEAGLRFLREQSDKDTSSTKMKWSSNAGY